MELSDHCQATLALNRQQGAAPSRIRVLTNVRRADQAYGGAFQEKARRLRNAGGWQIGERETILEAREQGVTAMLRRVLGEQPAGLDRATTLLRRAVAAAPWAGRPIFCGLRSLGYPSNPLGDLWRAADLVREHRGDSHVITWAVGGADAGEVLLLTEQWWGLHARAYTPTRGWTAADMEAGFARLRQRGLMTGDERITDAGRAFREEIEVRTDELERPVLDALGDDVDELLDCLDAWSEAIIASGSYPRRAAGVSNTGGGPHFGSGLTIGTRRRCMRRRRERDAHGIDAKEGRADSRKETLS